MEVMLWFLIPLAFVYYLDMEQKQKKLARRIQQLEKKYRKQAKGEITMSQIIENLVGSRCQIFLDETIGTTSTYELVAADEEWLTIRRTLKDGKVETRIVRIDNIKEIRPE